MIEHSWCLLSVMVAFFYGTDIGQIVGILAGRINILSLCQHQFVLLLLLDFDDLLVVTQVDGI